VGDIGCVIYGFCGFEGGDWWIVVVTGLGFWGWCGMW
jgi:hypothetical protein